MPFTMVLVGGILIFIALTVVHIQGQLAMKAKIRRQIDWGIENGRIKLEVDGEAKKCGELYGVICARDYPKK